MSTFSSSMVSALCFALVATACDDPPKPASASAPTAAPTPTPEVKASADKPAKPASPQRPEKLDTEVTAARREKIEKAHPEAKGFLVLKDVEDKLKTQKKLKEAKDGVRAFDALAKGKWVLFTGPLVESKDDGFSVGVSYTPLLEGDRVGLSRQFFLVALSDVKGYAKSDDMKDGTLVAVLAKYDGASKGGPGFELVAESNW
jgi:hypothetical protein